MAYFYGISSDNSRSFINNMLGSSGNVFGTTISGTNNPLGDMAMIKSGAYKKLLTAYYKGEKEESSDKTSTDTKTDKKNQISASSKELSAANSSSKKVMDSLDTLGQNSLYRSQGTDKDGNLIYNTDEIKSAVKTFVSAYNSYVEDNGAVKNASVSQKLVRAEKMTESNKKLLGEIGITIGSDNKISFDESKLDGKDISVMKSLFTGSGSYGFSMYDKAEESYKLTSSSAYSNNSASSYTNNGTHSALGSTNGIMDTYL